MQVPVLFRLRGGLSAGRERARIELARIRFLPSTMLCQSQGIPGWESELQTEVAPAYGLDAELIARRYDCDDALYRLEDGRVARVHLTWKQAQEIAPRWPETTIFPSLEHWADTGQRRDHAEWNGDYASGPASTTNDHARVMIASGFSS